MNITFVKTRWNYDSYADYWKLIELSGFPICYVDEMDVYDSDKVYIISPMNGEMLEFMTPERRNDKKAYLIQWNLERPSGSGNVAEYRASNQLLLEQKYFNEVMVSDMALSADTGFGYQCLGSHPKLQELDNYHKMFDIIHLSCYSPTRSWMFDSPSVPKSRIGKLTVAANGWGDVKIANLAFSRVMLAWHQDTFPYIEPLRYALAAAYKLPLIVQYSKMCYPYNSCVRSISYPRELEESFVSIITSYKMLSEEIYNLMCVEHTFESEVRKLWS